MPTLDELERALRGADAAGNTADAAKLARAYHAAKEELSRRKRQGDSGAGPHGRSPRDRLEQFRLELDHWERIKGSKDPQDFYAYLDKYPSGYISEQVQFRLDQLLGPGVVPVQGPNYPTPLPSGTRRYEVGDEDTHDFIDKLTGVVRRLTFMITFADDQRVEINGPLGLFVYDQMGGIIQNDGGIKTPPRLVAPADLAIGKRWQTAFRNVKADGFEEYVTWDYRVGALEPVTVPAGTFRTFRIEGRGYAIPASGRGGTQLKETRWIDPTLMRQIRTESEYRTRAGEIDLYNEARLVHRKLAPRVPRTVR